jgi:hypothetical protein
VVASTSTVRAKPEGERFVVVATHTRLRGTRSRCALDLPRGGGGLREILGLKLCAYLGSVKETRAVNEWAEGVREPSDAVQRRLRLALQVAGAIAEVDGPEVARAWFQGLNPQLDDRSPARLLREGDIDEVGSEVIAAERAFLVGG